MTDKWKTRKDRIDRKTGKRVRYRSAGDKGNLPKGLVVVSPRRHTTDITNLYGEQVSFIDDEGNEVHGKVTGVDVWDENHVPIEYEIEDEEGEYWAVSPDEVRYVTTRANVLKRRAERKQLLKKHYEVHEKYDKDIAKIKRRIRLHLKDKTISKGYRNELEALLRSMPD